MPWRCDLGLVAVDAGSGELLERRRARRTCPAAYHAADTGETGPAASSIGTTAWRRRGGRRVSLSARVRVGTGSSRFTEPLIRRWPFLPTSDLHYHLIRATPAAPDAVQPLRPRHGRAAWRRPASAARARAPRVARGSRLRVLGFEFPEPLGPRGSAGAPRLSSPRGSAAAQEPEKLPMAAARCRSPAVARGVGRTVPVAQRQKPHRRLDRRQRVTLTDVDVAVVNLHRQLPELVIGHARSALHARSVKSGSPTEGQPLRSALLRATPPPPRTARRPVDRRPRSPRPTELPPGFPEPRVGRMRRLQPSDLHPNYYYYYHPSASGPLAPLRRQQPHTRSRSSRRRPRSRR